MEKTTAQPFTIGSLFAGIGGIDLAFKKAGFKVAWANENDMKACQTYSLNHENLMVCQDVRQLEPNVFTKVDVITAGFPCQSFSIAGNRKGFSDNRGQLFFDVLRFVRALQPKAVFLENVKNLLYHNGGQTFEEIRQCFFKEKYTTQFCVLNTHQYSKLPQNRERLYIVALKEGKRYPNFLFPKREIGKLKIPEMLEQDVPSEYYYCKGKKHYCMLKKQVVNKQTCYRMRGTKIRENKKNLCPTLTANMGKGGNNIPIVLDDKGVRKLTPSEFAKFQGFTSSFKFPSSFAKSTLYTQIGNSVTVPVVEKIAEKIFQCLQNTEVAQ